MPIVLLVRYIYYLSYCSVDSMDLHGEKLEAYNAQCGHRESQAYIQKSPDLGLECFLENLCNIRMREVHF